MVVKHDCHLGEDPESASGCSVCPCHPCWLTRCDVPTCPALIRRVKPTPADEDRDVDPGASPGSH